MNESVKGSAVALRGSYLIPSFERATVADAMRAGVISCPPETTMAAVAAIMATEHVHAVVVTGREGDAPWGVVTDRDVLAAASDAHDKLAGWCAVSEVVTVNPGDSLERAADLMREHELTHLLVATGSGPPIGVLSSLEVAGVVAWGRG